MWSLASCAVVLRTGSFPWSSFRLKTALAGSGGASQRGPQGPDQGGYIFYAGGSLAGARYCRQCRRRPAILLLTPTVAGLQDLCENFRPTTSKRSLIQGPLSSQWATSVVRARVVGGGQRRRQLTPAILPPA